MMEVVLTARQEAFAKARVATGRYLDESEVIREALRLLEDSNLRGESLDLEARVAEGWESGGFEPWGGEMKERIFHSATVDAKP